VIPETWDEGMPIVQVKVHGLAEPTEETCDVEHMRQSASHCLLNVPGQEFGIPLRTGSLLLLQDPEVEVPDMVAGRAGLQVRFRLQDWPHAFCNGRS